MKKSKMDLVRGWLEKARRDLSIAMNNINSSEPFTDIICFHAQQAAEKYIKAYLVWQEIEFPKSHALEDLILLAAQKDASFLRFKEQLTELTPYAVEIRYPEFEEPLLVDAKKAVEIVSELKNFILGKLPPEANMR